MDTNTPPIETLSKIFLMEFIVDDLRLWQLPPDAIDSDPARLVFTYLDSVHVAIDKHEFDMANKNSGKNCLFTTDRRPTVETPVIKMSLCLSCVFMLLIVLQIKLMIYKKALEDELIKVGEGLVNIEQTFANLFRVSLPEPKPEGEEAIPGRKLII